MSSKLYIELYALNQEIKNLPRETRVESFEQCGYWRSSDLKNKTPYRVIDFKKTTQTRTKDILNASPYYEQNKKVLLKDLPLNKLKQLSAEIEKVTTTTETLSLADELRREFTKLLRACRRGDIIVAIEKNNNGMLRFISDEDGNFFNITAYINTLSRYNRSDNITMIQPDSVRRQIFDKVQKYDSIRFYRTSGIINIPKVLKSRIK